MQDTIQGVIAAIVMIGGLVLLGVYAVQGKTPDGAILAVVSMAISGVIGYFFGQRGVSSGVEKATNGMSDLATKVAAQIIHTQRQQDALTAAQTTASAEPPAVTPPRA